MDLPAEFKAALLEGRKMHEAGRLLEAERIYRTLAEPGSHRVIALEALAQLYLQQQRLDETLSTLKALTREEPDNLHYCAQLANFLDSVEQTREAIGEYLKFIDRHPDTAVAYFNIALLYRKNRQYEESIAAYEEALRLDIDHPEEAYSNMGGVYSVMQEEDKAREMYDRALEIVPDYIPALYNRAGHFEEVGEREKAIQQYLQILEIDPRHWDSLARLAYPAKIMPEQRDYMDRLEHALGEATHENMTIERLHFALGKSYDDLQDYDKASEHYAAANELGKQRAVRYEQDKTDTAFGNLIELFDADWISSHSSSCDAEPIFICGMFRSGSTLLERMLGAHPAITAGGEIEYLPWLINAELAPFPQGVADASKERLQRVREEYLWRVQQLYPGHDRITDKRPDNFLHVGLIKVLFPRAKIVHTRRNVLDNCLSLYFQQLGNNFSYATDLDNCAHYYAQQERLMEHWKSLFGEDILAVDYESLVVEPEPILRELLEFLGLSWDPSVLDFQKGSSTVKTASLWQVRQKLHTRSRGRWRNYAALLGDLAELAPDEDPAR